MSCDLVAKLKPPRAIGLMVPAAAAVVDAAIDELAPLLGQDDVLIDGGNSCETARSRGREGSRPGPA